MLSCDVVTVEVPVCTPCLERHYSKNAANRLKHQMATSAVPFLTYAAILQKTSSAETALHR